MYFLLLCLYKVRTFELAYEGPRKEEISGSNLLLLQLLLLPYRRVISQLLDIGNAETGANIKLPPQLQQLLF